MVTHTDNLFRTGLRPLVLLATILLASVTTSGCYTHAPHRYVDDDYYDDSYHYNYVYDDYYYEPRSHVAFEYYFYPDHHVYYDIHRHIYFYNHIHHGWIGVRVLPKHIVVNHHHRHKLKLHHRHPWKKHKITNIRRHHDKAYPGDRHAGGLKRQTLGKEKAGVITERTNKRGHALHRSGSERKKQPVIKQGLNSDQRSQRQAISTRNDKRKAIQSNVRRDERLEKRKNVTITRDAHRDKRSQQATADTRRANRGTVQTDARQDRRSEKRHTATTAQDRRQSQNIEQRRQPKTKKEVTAEARRNERHALTNERGSRRKQESSRDETNHSANSFQRDNRRNFGLRRN